jgi:hypothetical protein
MAGKESAIMAPKTRLLDRIEIEVTGFFTTHHVFQADGETLGELTFPAFSQVAEFHGADGRDLVMQRTHWLGSAHELLEGAGVRGTADRPGLLRRDIAIVFDGQPYSLEPEGAFSQGWYLADGEGNTLLEIEPRGLFRQGATITIHGEVHADLAIFAYYLVHVRQQEDAAAVAATSSVAVAS